MPKVQELRDVADWQRWANVGIQEQLCEKMEALKAVEDPEEIAKQVRDLQQQWRQAADVPRAQGEALWRRFKAAHDEAWTRCEAHFAAQAEARAENLAKKIALCERAEVARRVDQLDPDRRRDQEAAGRVEDDRPGQPRPGESRSGSASAPPAIASSPAVTPIWPSARRCGPRTSRRRKRSARRSKRSRDSTDWDAAATEIKRLQAEWKTIGPVKKTPFGSDVAAVPRRLRPVLRALRAAPRHRARRAGRRARGDLSRSWRRWRLQSPVASRQSAVRASRRESAVAARVFGRQSSHVEPAVGQLRVASPQSRSPQSASPAVEEPPADLMAHVRDAARRAGSRSLPRAASIAIARWRSTSASPRRSPRVIARWPSVFGGTDLDPDANRKKDGSARAADGGSREIARRAGVAPAPTPRSRRPRGWRRC